MAHPTPCSQAKWDFVESPPWCFCSPKGQRLIFRFRTEAELDSWCDHRKVTYDLRGNLKQLCGWAKTGNGYPRHEAADHFLLEHGRESWVQHSSVDSFIPLF